MITPQNSWYSYGKFLLYFFHFLHQTTTIGMQPVSSSRCISFIFYIKPQLLSPPAAVQLVVYLSFSTSNHNWRPVRGSTAWVVYLSFSTSNHNHSWWMIEGSAVVYLSFSTSNHNQERASSGRWWLYIFHFLHQTTTLLHRVSLRNRCISFIFYIKPQPLGC